MIDKKTLEKISKVNDKDIIKDILTANGYTTVQLIITEQKTDGIKCMSIKYTTAGETYSTFLRKDDNGFYEVSSDGNRLKKYEDKVIKEPDGIIKTDTYVGDSTKLYGDEIDEEMGKDERGKPVRKPFMETHGKRISQILWEIANQKADPHVKLTPEQQRKLEEKLDQSRKIYR